MRYGVSLESNCEAQTRKGEIKRELILVLFKKWEKKQTKKSQKNKPRKNWSKIFFSLFLLFQPSPKPTKDTFSFQLFMLYQMRYALASGKVWKCPNPDLKMHLKTFYFFQNSSSSFACYSSPDRARELGIVSFWKKIPDLYIGTSYRLQACLFLVPDFPRKTLRCILSRLIRVGKKEKKHGFQFFGKSLSPSQCWWRLDFHGANS